METMIYGVTDTPKHFWEWILYPIQQLLAVFVATVLIANVCGTPIDACLIGACVGTFLYQLITGGKSPMFISSCGATCSAVIGALAINGGNNYILVALGGAMIFIIYLIFGILARIGGIKLINKIFPPTIVGSVTIVIGLNLATFIPTYVQVDGAHSEIGILVAVFTMLIIAFTSHYFKGFLRTIPFLLGLLFGYVACVGLTHLGIANLVDLSVFKDMKIFNVPDFSFMHWDFSQLTHENGVQVALLFVPVAICAMLEHYSDHKVLSNIVGVDLTKKPGLHRTLIGDGLASFAGTVLCGLPNTSYGESIATTGFSRVASTKIITVAAALLGVLAFLNPVQIFVQSIPSCVFGGCAMILYGYIAVSGLKTLLNSGVDLNKNKNLVIVSVVLTVGVSGIYFYSESFAGVSLAMVLGVIINILLIEFKPKKKK